MGSAGTNRGIVEEPDRAGECDHTAAANSSPSDRLAKALTALGRVIKTIYILRYIHDEELRSRVQLQLNRGESRHDLVARCLFFANRGEFRTGDVEEIMNNGDFLKPPLSFVMFRYVPFDGQQNPGGHYPERLFPAQSYSPRHPD